MSTNVHPITKDEDSAFLRLQPVSLRTQQPAAEPEDALDPLGASAFENFDMEAAHRLLEAEVSS